MEVPAGYILIKEGEYQLLLMRLSALEKQVGILSQENQMLRLENDEFRKRFALNSSNSHKPPSTDGFKKTIKNNHQVSGKKVGGQPGHTGETLQMVEVPDRIIVHEVKGKCQCGRNLRFASYLDYNRRQVFDIPKPRFEVTEHRNEIKQCQCGLIHYGEQENRPPVQYGAGVLSLSVYLNQYGFIPFKRQKEFWKDFYGMNVSVGMLLQANEKCYTDLASTEQIIKQAIISSPVIHNDETGINCEGKTKWVHTSSTELFTHLAMHEKRGAEAIDCIKILPDFSGVSVHDRYSSYDKYPCKHALCNAHIIRDLKYLHEEENKEWAGKMIPLLVNANQTKEKQELGDKIIKNIKACYDSVIKAGMRGEPDLPIMIVKKRGRRKKSKSLLLLEALIKRKDQVLGFLDDPLVPFTNNQAERDLRPVKGKLKISGCFRTDRGAQIYCRIRSYISTVKKHGLPVLDALQKALEGNSVNFNLSSTT